ncbi:MAG TPA: helix-turn-helix domain-containing protein [Rugosimonospora sp.]|nr:helix-turn-helix domain-containing protein [Rugosimonospora sp.]
MIGAARTLTGDGATGAAGGAARPSLAERRRTAIRMEITRAAVRLFTSKGVVATTGEEIAAAAGISVRTLWRHFPKKESCVLPLLAAGLDTAAQALSAWTPDQSVADLLDTIEQAGVDLIVELTTVLDLVRLTRTEPGLRAVWLQAHHDAEPAFAAALAQRAGLSGDELAVKVRAAMLNGMLRAAVEHYAFHTAPSDVSLPGILTALREAFATVAEGLPV